MTNDSELVKYGLKNVHVAILNTETGEYGEPFAIPGAVSLTGEPKGDTTVFYADNRAYYTTSSNNGYEGDLEVALVPIKFDLEILKKELDAKNVVIEVDNPETVYFAMMFEVNTDKKARRQIYYRCTASRNGIDAKTTENSKEPQPEKLAFKAETMEYKGKYIAKGYTTESTDSEVYSNWYSKVYLPEFE